MVKDLDRAGHGSYPKSRRSRANVRFAPDFVRFTPRSRPSWWCGRRSAFDPGCVKTSFNSVVGVNLPNL